MPIVGLSNALINVEAATMLVHMLAVKISFYQSEL